MDSRWTRLENFGKWNENLRLKKSSSMLKTSVKGMEAYERVMLSEVISHEQFKEQSDTYMHVLEIVWNFAK